MRPVRILGAAAAYSLVLMAAGWILGPLRVLLIEPRVGPVLAVWLEAPLMAVAIFLAARWVVGRFALAGAGRESLLVGLTALVLVILAEGLGGLAFRDRSLLDMLQGWISPAGWPVIGLYLLLMLAPWTIGRMLTAAAPPPSGAGSGPAHFPEDTR